MMISKKDIWEELIKINQKITEMNQSLEGMKDIIDFEKIKGVLEQTNQRFSESISSCSMNISRLQSMTNEVKGCVSMARAALDEGRKFTEMTELNNVLFQISGDVHMFRRLNNRLSDMCDKFTVSCGEKWGTDENRT